MGTEVQKCLIQATTWTISDMGLGSCGNGWLAGRRSCTRASLLLPCGRDMANSRALIVATPVPGTTTSAMDMEGRYGKPQVKRMRVNGRGTRCMAMVLW